MEDTIGLWLGVCITLYVVLFVSTNTSEVEPSVTWRVGLFFGGVLGLIIGSLSF